MLTITKDSYIFYPAIYVRPFLIPVNLQKTFPHETKLIWSQVYICRIPLIAKLIRQLILPLPTKAGQIHGTKVFIGR